MKKFTTFMALLAALLLAIPVQAKMWNWTESPEFVSSSATSELLQSNKRLARATLYKPAQLAMLDISAKSRAAGQLKAPRQAASDYVIITDQPEGELKTFHRSGSYLYADEENNLYIGKQSGNVDIVFGADGAIYIKNPLMGTAYDSWVSGTYDATAGKVTIPVPQNLFYASTYDACIAMVPIISYSSTDFTAQNITYTVTNSADGMVLTLDGFTSYAKTLGAGWTDDFTIGLYGEYSTVLTEGAEAAPEPVVAPEGAEFKEYAVSGIDYYGDPYNGSFYIAIVGNDVYLKGYSQYIPDALIKGTKDGNTITFPADQYLGTDEGDVSYFMPSEHGGTDAVFTYDADKDTYTAEGDVFSIIADTYIDVWVTNPVLKGVVEVAAMPANPSISGIESSSWGQIVVFSVPNVDTEGNGLAASKLSYQFFVDVEKEITPLVFTPATHEKLTENMTVIPFGFTDNWDIFQGQIYLNGLYSTTWNKIGIKSIYTGGGVTNETEIQWYTLKGYANELLEAEIGIAEQLVADTQYKAGQTALNAAIDAAKAVLNSTEATAAEQQAAIDTLKAAENEFKTLNTAYSRLEGEIAEAEALKTDGLTRGLTDFNAAIADATAVLNGAASTSVEMNIAYNTLQQAEAAFLAANGLVTATWNATQQGYTNNQVIESAVINDDLTLTLAKNEGSSAPAYYTSGTSIRVYDKNSFTITGGEKVAKITKIVITQSGSSYGTQLKANVGELTKSNATLTWEGEATEVVFTNDRGDAGSTVQTRFRTLTIDYMQVLEPEPFDPSTALVNADFEGEYTVYSNPSADRAIYQPEGWTISYENGEGNDMTSLNSSCSQWNQFEDRPQPAEGGNNTYWIRLRWGNSEILTLSQTVTLPAGDYKLSADAFFNGAAGATAKIFAGDNTTVIPAAAAWANYSVTFVSDGETPVTLGFGLVQTQAKENVAGFDNFKLETFDPLADAKATLDAEIAAAQELLADETNTEGRQELTDAIATAQQVLAAATTAEVLTAAVSALQDAEKAFKTANLPVAEGVYYVYNPYTQKFLSRGADWGTHAMVDDYGFPISVTQADEKYTLANVDGIGAYGDDYWMYADAGGDRVRTFIIEKTEGGFYLHNSSRNVDDNRVYVYLKDDGKYKVAGNAVVGDNVETLEQAVWQFLTQAERDAILADNIAAQEAAALTAAGIAPDAELEEGEAVSVDVTSADSWTQNVVRTQNNQPSVNANGMEMWQATGSFTKTIEGLPSGLYKLSVNAFYRDGDNAAVAAFADQGYNLSVAYLEANGSKAQIKSWGIDRSSNDAPNSMGEAAALFAEGKYLSETYAYVGDDGLLNLTLANPSHIGNGWFIVGKVTYTPVTAAPEPEPVDYVAYSWESPEGEPIETGGVISYENGDGNRLNYENSGYYTICLNGKKANINDAEASANAGHMLVKLDEALRDGDVIKITGYITKSSSSKSSAYIFFGDGAAEAESPAFGDEANIYEGMGGAIQTYEVAVPEAAFGSTTFKMTRGQTGTNLFITKLEITNPNAPEPAVETVVVVPETATVEDWTLEGSYKTAWGGAEAQYVTKVAFDGESDIYINGLSYEFNALGKDSWVKGTISGNKVIVKSGQLIADFPEDGEKYYLLGSDDGETLTDIVFDYDAEAKTLKAQTKYIFTNFNQSDAINSDYLSWYENVELYFGAPAVEEPVAAPEGLVTEAWNLQSTIYYDETEFEAYAVKVQVGFDGDDAYIKGFDWNAADLWIKATKNAAGQYVVPAMQYMGEVGFFAKTKYYFTAVDASGAAVDAVFDYDAEARQFTTTQTLVTSKSKKAVDALSTFKGTTTITAIPDVVVDQLPYANAFATVEERDAFKVIDANDDNTTWILEDGDARYSYNWQNAGDDWLVTPKIMLEAGKTYSFSIDAKASHDGATERIEVKLAAESTAAALTAGTVVIAATDLVSTDYETLKNSTVTVSETGYYSFGIHAISDADLWGLYVTNLLVEEAGGAEPGDLASGTYYTAGGGFYIYNGSSFEDFTDLMPSVEVAVDGNNVTITGLAFYFPEGAITGTLNGNTITFPNGQLVGTDNYGDEYLVASVDGETAAESIVFTFDPATKTLSSTQYIAESEAPDQMAAYSFWYQPVFSAEEPVEQEPVTAPENLETETYTFAAKATGHDESVTDPYTLLVQVGFDGDDLYIQGLSEDVPELWVKATKNASGQYVVPANQFMGNLSFYGYVFPYYWTGVDAQGNLADAVFNLDATTGTLTGAGLMAINADANTLDYNLLFENVVISKFQEVAATPADPTFEAFNLSQDVGYTTIYASVPAVGTNGEVLNTDKLFYIVWIEKDGQQQPYTFTSDLYYVDFSEDVTEVPYSHDGYDIYRGGEIIYLEDELDELASWTKVGIQSVYYGGDERHESNVVWNDGTVTGISPVAAADAANVRFFDLQGRAVDRTQKGLVIMQFTDAQGRVKTVKTVRK